MDSEVSVMLSADDEEHWERSGFLTSIDEISRINDTIRWSGASINEKFNVDKLPLEPRSLHSSIKQSGTTSSVRC